MRCKVGDLAMFVGNSDHKTPDCLGRIVRCVCLVSKGRGMWDSAWIVEPPLPFKNCDGRMCADALLLPLRPPQEQDETLTWLDVPHKEVA